jgi:electron transport complex protein RnfB
MVDALTALFVMAGLAAAIGFASAVVARVLPASDESPVDRINELLPQTQCAQCGYPGCRPYAEAIIAGNANIDQCAPGGDALVSALARLMGRRTTTLNPAYGTATAPAVAVIDEEACIGCAICIAACPVDAILGAARYTHTIIQAECTGCELCIAPCPVDCISMTALPGFLSRANGSDTSLQAQSST